MWVSENQDQPFRFCFNLSWNADFQGSRVTSHAAWTLGLALNESVYLNKTLVQPLTEDRYPSGQGGFPPWRTESNCARMGAHKGHFSGT
jgi:hypothetical protein